MTKKIKKLAFALTVLTCVSCADNSNEDHTDVENTGSPNTGINSQSTDTSQTGNNRANDTGTSGVNYSKVKK